MNLPAPIRALVSWIRGEREAFEPNLADRNTGGAYLDQLNFARVKRALAQWALGNPREMAIIFEQFRRFPVIRGITRQVLAAVKAVDTDVLPATGDGIDPERAQKHAELMRGVWERIRDRFIDTVMRIRWEGGGFYEPDWREDANKRFVPVDTKKIPLQRVRRDWQDGQLTFAKSAFDFEGKPLTEWPRGVFITVDPEADVQDFSCRGEFVAALTDLWRLREVLSWWATDVEKSESPTALLRWANEDDRKSLRKAAENWGNGGRVLVSTKSDAQILEKKSRPAFQPHDLYEQRTKARLASLFTGAEQTFSVAPDSASKASAGVHEGVADNTMRETWRFIQDCANELARVMAWLNEGDERYAATIVADLDDAPNVGQILKNFTLAKGLITTSEEQLREETGLRKPGEGETPIPMSGDGGSPAAEENDGPIQLREAA